MGADISVESVAGKLNRVGYEAFIQALRQAKSAGNRNIELGALVAASAAEGPHRPGADRRHFKLNRAKMLADVDRGGQRLPPATRRKCRAFPTQVADALDRGWHYATLLFGETQIRTGHVLVAMLKSLELRRALVNLSPEFAKIPVDEARRSTIARSGPNPRRATCARWTARASPPPAPRARPRAGRQGHDRARPLQPGPDRQGQDRRNGPDPRPRRGNPADRRRADAPAAEQPDPHRRSRRRQDRGRRGLRAAHRRRATCRRRCAGVKLCALDIGLMQAGASMKGEFEQRLRSVIDEVQSSPTPIILFIDEAHTLIGAGGAGRHRRRRQSAEAGAGARHVAHDRRDDLERIPPIFREGPGADPALPADPDRRARCRQGGDHAARPDRADGEAPQGAHLRRGDRRRRAICRTATSRRGNLPDKAVSLLDTACARVAISQTAKPAAIEDAEVAHRRAGAANAKR